MRFGNLIYITVYKAVYRGSETLHSSGLDHSQLRLISSASIAIGRLRSTSRRCSVPTLVVIEVVPHTETVRHTPARPPPSPKWILNPLECEGVQRKRSRGRGTFPSGWTTRAVHGPEWTRTLTPQRASPGDGIVQNSQRQTSETAFVDGLPAVVGFDRCRRLLRGSMCLSRVAFRWKMACGVGGAATA